MTRYGPTRYQPIVDYLAAREGREVALTFAQIEAILGAPLPDSAYAITTYWTGTNFIHVRRWQALGWRARVDRSNRRIVFTRDAEE